MRAFTSAIVVLLFVLSSCEDVSKVPNVPSIAVNAGASLNVTLQGGSATASSDTISVSFVTKYENNQPITDPDKNLTYRVTVWEKNASTSSFFAPLSSNSYTKAELKDGLVFNADITQHSIWPILPSREIGKVYQVAVQAVTKTGVGSKVIPFEVEPLARTDVQVLGVYDQFDRKGKLVLGQIFKVYGYDLAELDSVKIKNLKLEVLEHTPITFGDYRAYGLSSYTVRMSTSEPLVGTRTLSFYSDKSGTPHKQDVTVVVEDQNFAQPPIIDSIKMYDASGVEIKKYCLDNSVKVTNKKTKCLVLDRQSVRKIKMFGYALDDLNSKITVMGMMPTDKPVLLAEGKNDLNSGVNGVLEVAYDPRSAWSGRIAVSLDGTNYYKTKFEFRRLLYTYIDKKVYAQPKYFVGSPIELKLTKKASGIASKWHDSIFVDNRDIKEMHYASAKFQRTDYLQKEHIIVQENADQIRVLLDHLKDTLDYSLTNVLLEQARVDKSSGQPWVYYAAVDSASFVATDYRTIETLKFDDQFSAAIKGGKQSVFTDSVVVLEGKHLTSATDTVQVWIGQHKLDKKRYKEVSDTKISFLYPPVEYRGTLRLEMPTRTKSGMSKLNVVTKDSVVFNRGEKYKYNFFYNKKGDKALVGGYDVLFFEKNPIIDVTSEITPDMEYISGKSYVKFKALDPVTHYEKYSEKIIKEGSIFGVKVTLKEFIDSLGFYIDEVAYHRGDSLVFTTVFEDYKGDKLSEEMTSFILDEDEFYVVDFKPKKVEIGDIMTITLNDLPNNLNNSDISIKMGNTPLASSNIIERGVNWIKVKVPATLSEVYGFVEVNYTGGASPKKAISNKAWYYDYTIDAKVVEEIGLDKQIYFSPKRHGRRAKMSDSLFVVKTNAPSKFKNFGTYTVNYKHKDSLEWVQAFERKLASENLTDATIFEISAQDLIDDQAKPKAKDDTYDYKWSVLPDVKACSGSSFEVSSKEDFEEFLVPNEEYDLEVKWEYKAGDEMLTSVSKSRVTVLPKGQLDLPSSPVTKAVTLKQELDAVREFLCNLDSISGTDASRINWLKKQSDLGPSETYYGLNVQSNGFVQGLVGIEFTVARIGDVRFHSTRPIKGLNKLTRLQSFKIEGQPTMNIKFDKNYETMGVLSSFSVLGTHATGILPPGMCTGRTKYTDFKLRINDNSHHKDIAEVVDCHKKLPLDPVSGSVFFDEYQALTQLNHILGFTGYPAAQNYKQKNSRITSVIYDQNAAITSKNSIEDWDLSYLLGDLDTLVISNVTGWKGIPKVVAKLVDSSLLAVDFSGNKIGLDRTKLPEHLEDYAGLKYFNISNSNLEGELPEKICEKREKFADFVLFERGKNPILTSNRVVDCDSQGMSTGQNKLNFKQAQGLYTSAMYFSGMHEEAAITKEDIPFDTVNPSTHADFKVTVDNAGLIRSINWEDIYSKEDDKRDSASLDLFLRYTDTLVVQNFESLHGLMVGGNYLAAKKDKKHTQLTPYFSIYRELDSLSLYGNYMSGSLSKKMCDKRLDFSTFKLQKWDGDINDDLTKVLDCNNPLFNGVHFRDKQAMLSFADMMKLSNSNISFPNSSNTEAVINGAKFNSDIFTSSYVDPGDGEYHQNFTAIIDANRIIGLYYINHPDISASKYLPQSDVSISDWTYVDGLDSIAFIDIQGFNQDNASLSGWFKQRQHLAGITGLRKLDYIRIADSKVSLKLPDDFVPSKQLDLRMLDLQGNVIDSNMTDVLAKNYPYINILNLSRNRIDTLSASAIPNELTHLNITYNPLDSLDLEGNDYLVSMRMRGMKIPTTQLKNALEDLPKSITFLDASYADKRDASIDMPSLSRMSKVEVLDIGNTALKFKNNAQLPINRKMYLLHLGESDAQFNTDMSDFFRALISGSDYSCAIIWYDPYKLQVTGESDCLRKR